MSVIINGDCKDVLGTMYTENIGFDVIFADPPDNIGLGYDECRDRRPDYMAWLTDITEAMLRLAPIVWVSYNARWDLEYKAAVLPFRPRYDVEIKPFVQTFTFGQHRHTDCGNNHRPILRFKRSGTPIYPDAIRVESDRQRQGDRRADPRGRVPGDVWEFTRVTNRNRQRRSWHPTQLHEGLVERALKLSTGGVGTVLDPFLGTGTTMRVAHTLGMDCTGIEMSRDYARRAAEENSVAVVDFQ